MPRRDYGLRPVGDKKLDFGGICNSFAASVDVMDAEAVVSKSHVSLPNDCSVLAHFRENKPGRGG